MRFNLTIILKSDSPRIVAKCIMAVKPLTYRISQEGLYKCTHTKCFNHVLFKEPYDKIKHNYIHSIEYETDKIISKEYPCTFLCFITEDSFELLLNKKLNKWAILNCKSEIYHKREIATIIIKKLVNRVYYDTKTIT